MQTALADGDEAEALRNAEAAYGLAHTAPWAWRALLEARLEAGDWPAALALVRGALERKIVSPLTAERARAALQAASAAHLESGGPGDAGQALEFAQAAARSQPDFSPGAVIAARLLTADGRGQRAAPLLEAAWKARAHPALWLAWRDLRTDETPRERAARLAALAATQPERAREPDPDRRAGADRRRHRGRPRRRQDPRGRAHHPAPGRADGAGGQRQRRPRRRARLDRPWRGRASRSRMVGHRPSGSSLRLHTRRLGAPDGGLRRDRRTHSSKIRAPGAQHQRPALDPGRLCRERGLRQRRGVRRPVPADRG